MNQPDPNAQLRLAIIAAGLGICLFVAVTPIWLGHVIGALATAVLALTGALVTLGVAVAFAQETAPAEVFRVLKLRSTPVTSVFAAALLVASLSTSGASIHPVRSGPAPIPTRPTLAQSFATWLAVPSACARTIRIGQVEVGVRPMLIVAAEGGGIRATYWTAAAMERIAGSGSGCGGTATLFSTGASGGSVGLTVARFASASGPPGATSPLAQVRRMAGPDALGAGVSSLIIRDTLRAAAGVPLPTFGSADAVSRLAGVGRATTGKASAADHFAWADRAALIEAAWQTEASSLDQPFVPAQAPTKETWPMTGPLILGSTSVSTGCRTLISQIDLTAGRPGAGIANCDTATAAAPFSVDLLSGYGQTGPQGATRACLGDLPAATAALLSARFPYVTPAGFVDACGNSPALQLIDGGYAENSGLGTIVDLAPQWLTQVQAHNSAAVRNALAGNRSGTPLLIVVPTIVWLANGSAADLASAEPSSTAELLVPPVGQQRAGSSQKEPPALLQRAEALVTDDQLCGPAAMEVGPVVDPQLAIGCSVVSRAVHGWLSRGRVVVVHRASTPAVEAPLGWVLSQTSMENLSRDLDQQQTLGCSATDDVCRRGYSSLKDLVAFLSADR